ncbi:MAG: DUF115 domain-containing protein [Treponemataceae bacterium]|nr:DUF115 domain-containing protein [Treponemataceae bacterium]
MIEAKQGFSVLYKGRFLYSKYSPSANCLKLVENLNQVTEHLIIINSPILGYGLEELIEKIDEKCYVLAIEHDKNLHDFSLKQSFDYNKVAEKASSLKKRFSYVLLENEKEAVEFFSSDEFQAKIRSCKHITSLDFSAINPEHKEFYQHCTDYASMALSQFWKNKMTITKLAHLYNKNIIQNLAFASKCEILKKQSISKPILVFGTGPSLDVFFDSIKNNRSDWISFINENFFTICVDNSLKPLSERGIKCDAVVLVESQLAIEKAFIGTQKESYTLICDLSSRTNLIKYAKKNPENKIAMIFTEYQKLGFLSAIKERLPDLTKFNPAGSVGLYAMEIASFLRKPGTPIFFTGLDFSFELGKTHCRNAAAHFTRLISTNRINPIINVASSYRYGARKIENSNLFTDIGLEGYSKNFIQKYENLKALYNLSSITLGKIENIDIQKFILLSKTSSDKNQCEEWLLEKSESDRKESESRIKDFIESEKKELELIKDSLINGTLSSEELCRKINEHEYLFIHFPDGNDGCQNNLSFFKRVRSEIDYFLKIFTLLSF